MFKRTIYIIILSALAFSCKKDPEISESQADYFLKVFGGSSTVGSIPDCCNAIYKSGDEFLLAGSIHKETGPDMFLFRTDRFGNEISWSPKQFGTELTEAAYDIAIDKDQNIYLAGHSESASSSDVFVVKTDQDGNEIWSKTFGGAGKEKAFSINTSLSHTIFVAGYTESVSYDIKKRQGWLLAISENGDSLWSQDYGFQSDDEINEIVNLKDSLLLIGSTKSPLDNNKSNVFLFILKKSTKGIENFREFYEAGSETGISAVQTTSGEIIVLGYKEGSNSKNNIYLWKIGEDLQIIKQQIITSAFSETPSAIMIDDGTLVVVGTVINEQNNEDMLVYTVDTNLTVISRNTYGSKGNQRGTTGIITGKSVIIGGCTTSGSSSKASIFKTPEILP